MECPRLFTSSLNDPFVNLALENSLLNQIKTPSLFLYQNDLCVVIGRAQNPWVEADLNFMSQHNIPLVRRQSGGGTVVHDTGNLNLCLLAPRAEFNKMALIHLIQAALSSLGVHVEIGEHYDLLLQQQKVSGSAFRETRTNCFHHATLLINSDLACLRRCLKTPDRNIISRAIPSRRSPVMNLTDLFPLLQMSDVRAAVITLFCQRYNIPSDPICILTRDVFFDTNIEATVQYYHTDSWLYDRTLPFTEVLSFDGQLIHLSVEGGQITKIEPDQPEISGFLNQSYLKFSKFVITEFQ